MMNRDRIGNYQDHAGMAHIRLLMCNDPDVVACKVYFPEEGQLQVHQSRTTPCPPGFHNGLYWYGKRQASLSHYPQWIDNIDVDDKSSDEVDVASTGD